ncbi:MAG: FtsW/RodA/SpoVE family cell cycle protein [Bacteroidales bacterium]|nr:FtsW/RodA/SpoVE family cell cycle protein [Bacteroidales bacterium]
MSAHELGDKARTIISSVRGDKMLLLVVILLYLFSINAVLSSSSLLFSSELSGLGTLATQLGVIVTGSALMILVYKVCTLKGLMKMGLIGFIISFFLLVYLTLHIKIPGVLVSQNINHSWRTLQLFGHIQIHVFEIVKVFSVMYMAWAATCYAEEKALSEEGLSEEELLEDRRGFFRLRRIAIMSRLNWLRNPRAWRIAMVYLPFALVSVMVMRGSNSSLLIIGFGMFITLFIGGFDRKNLLLFILLCGLAGGGMMTLMKDADSSRGGTFLARIEAYFTPFEQRLEDVREGMKNGTKNRTDYNNFIDENRQVQGAKFAIREGRVTPFGKGPGGSTQKYKVMQIFGDFMFSFICEEYGILGAVFVLFLFGCLIARGTRIANYCESRYARTLVAGLVLLISGQAIIHILVNVGILPMTGQTLPVLSDGKSAFIMFSIAFGVVLGISRLVRERIEKEEGGLEPVISHEGNDEVQNSLDDLDALDTNGLQ